MREAKAARWFIAAVVGLALVNTASTILLSWHLAHFVSELFIDHLSVSAALPHLWWVLPFGALRAVCSWVGEVLATRAALAAKTELRAKLLQKVSALGGRWLTASGLSQTKLGILATVGLDALDVYFAKYLPQLVFTALATPIFTIVIWSQDVLSGVAVLVTLPLIPLFMIFIGFATSSVQKRQLNSMVRLGNHFIELVRGLTTLRVFGRAEAQIERLEASSNSYRVRTMKLLRVSFLSGFALELIASLSVALIAVSIGLRLVDGTISLGVGLFVLLLAPETFLPLRMVGTNFHAASEGVAAAEAVFEVLETSTPGVPVGAAETSPQLNSFEPGQVSVITGVSGAGKSTLFARWLDECPEQCAWQPQSATLWAGSVEQNVVGFSELDLVALNRALELAAICESDFHSQTQVGDHGNLLSGGQRQRVALARAIYRALTVDSVTHFLLDEGTSALNPALTDQVLSGLRKLTAEGYAVVAISHQAQVIKAAERVHHV
ncbi:MAG: thiol reductant exporter subunit CydD [Actinomycetota bacterium]